MRMRARVRMHVRVRVLRVHSYVFDHAKPWGCSCRCCLQGTDACKPLKKAQTLTLYPGVDEDLRDERVPCCARLEERRLSLDKTEREREQRREKGKVIRCVRGCHKRIRKHTHTHNNTPTPTNEHRTQKPHALNRTHLPCHRARRAGALAGARCCLAGCAR